MEKTLLQTEKLLDDLEQIGTRIDAAIRVWPETRRTLQPALDKQHAIVQEITELKGALEELWNHGYASKWK